MLDGITGRSKLSQEIFFEDGHPSIILSGKIKKSSDFYQKGTVLARDAEGFLKPWLGEGQPLGILTSDCDSTKNLKVFYLAHGLCPAHKIIKNGGKNLNQIEIDQLAAIGIYGV